MKHQWTGVRLIEKHNGRFGVFCAPGTGKTLIAIKFAHKNKLNKNIVFSRRDDFLTWQNELYLEGVTSDRICFVPRGSRINWKKEIINSSVEWVIVTYGSLGKYRNQIKRTSFKLAIAEESHLIKHWKSQRTKNAIRVSRHIPCRIAQTGTPITNDVGDLWSQSMFVDGGATYGDNWWRFRKRHYGTPGNFPGWFLKKGAKKAIMEKLHCVAFYVHEDDVLKLPPIRNIVIPCPMTKLQQVWYQRVAQEWEYKFPDGDIIEIDHVVSQLQKMRQVASGFICSETGVSRPIGSGKLIRLISFLHEPQWVNKKKIVIWAVNIYTIKLLKRWLNHYFNQRVVTFYGHNPKQKRQAREQFANDHKTKFFIGQADSGIGMNELVVANTGIYFDNSFRVDSRMQSKRRIRRKGSEKHKTINYIDFVTEDSMDVHILNCLRQNQSVADFVLSIIRLKKIWPSQLTKKF
jgi:SNF2 family DNA or RNA helicase